jgi:hypothetical protein
LFKNDFGPDCSPRAIGEVLTRAKELLGGNPKIVGIRCEEHAHEPRQEGKDDGPMGLIYTFRLENGSASKLELRRRIDDYGIKTPEFGYDGRPIN